MKRRYLGFKIFQIKICGQSLKTHFLFFLIKFPVLKAFFIELDPKMASVTEGPKAGPVDGRTK